MFVSIPPWNPALQVYIGMTFYKSKDFGDFSWYCNDTQDSIAREAFRSVLVIAPDPSVYTLPSSLNIRDLNFGYVSALNQTYPIKDLVRWYDIEN